MALFPAILTQIPPILVGGRPKKTIMLTVEYRPCDSGCGSVVSRMNLLARSQDNRQTRVAMTLPSTPHDSLFRALVSNPRRVLVLLEEYLPKMMTVLIDFEHPPER